tara:strand:- start:904 stop:1188 length:285 start_codon:yes stop_codon:yes gene_type:complete
MKKSGSDKRMLQLPGIYITLAPLYEKTISQHPRTPDWNHPPAPVKQNMATLCWELLKKFSLCQGDTSMTTVSSIMTTSGTFLGYTEISGDRKIR